MDGERPTVETCDFLCVHEDTVRAVLAQMPAEEKLYDLAELFKVFGDSTRVKILYALFEAEMCVCDIAAASEHEFHGGVAPIAHTQGQQAGSFPPGGAKTSFTRWRTIT